MCSRVVAFQEVRPHLSQGGRHLTRYVWGHWAVHGTIIAATQTAWVWGNAAHGRGQHSQLAVHGFPRQSNMVMPRPCALALGAPPSECELALLPLPSPRGGGEVSPRIPQLALETSRV